MKKLLALLLAVMMVFTLVGCSKSVAGTYKMTKAEMGGTELPMDAAPEMTITLNKDGTVVLSSEGESENGTWTQNGDTLTLSSDEGEDMDLTVDGNNLIMEQSGVTVTFSK